MASCFHFLCLALPTSICIRCCRAIWPTRAQWRWNAWPSLSHSTPDRNCWLLWYHWHPQQDRPPNSRAVKRSQPRKTDRTRQGRSWPSWPPWVPRVKDWWGTTLVRCYPCKAILACHMQSCGVLCGTTCNFIPASWESGSSWPKEHLLWVSVRYIARRSFK